MSTLSAPVRSVKPTRQRKPLAPVSGTARVLRPVGAVNDRTGEVLISGKPYYLLLTGCGYRLTGFDERQQAPTVYDLPLSLDSCDCPDAIYASERPGGCKHKRALQALRAAGKLPEAVDEVSAPDPDDLGESFGSCFDAEIPEAAA